MNESNHPTLSVGTQCRLLQVSRSSFYYEPQGETETNLGVRHGPRTGGGLVAHCC